MKIFIAPANVEILQVGDPTIVATEDGVGPMQELTGIKNVQFTERWP